MSGLSPVIVLGMHRSGTTLVTELLERHGVFMGARTERNHESLFFKKLNNWVLRLAGTSWQYPDPLDALLEDERARAVVTDQLRRIVHGPMTTRYLGRRAVRGFDLLGGLDVPWGWKDPRSTLTLPLWLDLFPDARLVVVTRHGVDVAASIRSRVRKDLGRAEKRLAGIGRYPVDDRQLIKLVGGLRGATLDGAFATWVDYLERSERNTAAAGDRVLSLRYEELLTDPARELARTLDFVGLPRAGADAVSTEGIDAGRAFAFARDEELARFAHEQAAALDRWGYAADGAR